MSIRKQMYKHNKDERKAWTNKEAEGFLHFYKARKSEFNCARKKRKAYNNVLNDMIAAGITSPKTTVRHLEVKMTTLQRAYRLLKNDSTTKHVLTPCMLQIQEILEDELKISDNSLNIGLSTIDTDPVLDDYGDTKALANWDNFSANEHIKMDPDTVCEDASSFVYVKSENSDDTIVTAVMTATLPSSTAYDSSPCPDTPALLLTNSSQNKKPKMNRSQYLEEKLSLKMNAEKNKTERWEQFKAIEEKKIELLEKLLESLKK